MRCKTARVNFFAHFQQQIIKNFLLEKEKMKNWKEWKTFKASWKTHEKVLCVQSWILKYVYLQTFNKCFVWYILCCIHNDKWIGIMRVFKSLNYNSREMRKIYDKKKKWNNFFLRRRQQDGLYVCVSDVACCFLVFVGLKGDVSGWLAMGWSFKLFNNWNSHWFLPFRSLCSPFVPILFLITLFYWIFLLDD